MKTSVSESVRVKLPPPVQDSATSLESALASRRSIRAFTGDPLSSADLSQLLWAAQGVTDPRGLRTAPSPGALYPLDVLAVVGSVAGLTPGVYRYLPEHHEIELILEGDCRPSLAKASLGQFCIQNAPLSLLITGRVERLQSKYGEKSHRYLYLEAGHICQNVLLQITSLHLGGVPIGAFRGDEVKNVLSLDPADEPLYIVSLGKPVVEHGR